MLCLTFDTDHCDDGRMREWLDACEFPGRATIFCTRRFDFLGGTGHEIAPHPFSGGAADVDSEIKRWREAFPAATCWRSHSLVTSQAVSICLGRAGYRITSTAEMFAHKGIRPLRSPWGIWEMPIFYMDNSDFSRSDYGTIDALAVFDPRIIEAAVAGKSLYVFDFHPIHYLLNTPNYRYYVDRAPSFKEGADLAQLRHGGYGAASFFDDLVHAMRTQGVRSLTLPEALDAWCSENGNRSWEL